MIFDLDIEIEDDIIFEVTTTIKQRLIFLLGDSIVVRNIADEVFEMLDSPKGETLARQFIDIIIGEYVRILSLGRLQDMLFNLTGVFVQETPDNDANDIGVDALGAICEFVYDGKVVVDGEDDFDDDEKD
jgi:hypothetical protein